MGKFRYIIFACLSFIQASIFAEASWLPEDFTLFNVTAPFFPTPGKITPVPTGSFPEHVRGRVETGAEWATAEVIRIDNNKVVFEPRAAEFVDGKPVTASAVQGSVTWLGTLEGLYCRTAAGISRHNAYGAGGPLATQVTGLVSDSRETLWVGTPLGLSLRTADGEWSHIQGAQGLPVEDITALALDRSDRIWIGTSQGAILYKPYEEGRQWFYRAGKRYLPGDAIKSIAVAPEGSPVYFLTDAGPGRLDVVSTTLLEKADTIEKRVNERHRRLGLVADCVLDNAEDPTAHSIEDNDNDGLWTAYHVAAMSLCYGATGNSAARESARESMHALYRLQNVSGIPGLVARSVVPAEIGKTKSEQWRPTPDGTLYWKSDTSSDEIDGHYLAFYTYYEHIANADAAERALIEKQVRALTDYLVNNNYQLIDWDGKRTRWGFWNPEALNGNPLNYVESGLNALQILSFLKVAHHITGEANYESHYRKLIVEHHYLDNILLTKKCFPDENNHSDDQLGFVAWYPILQLERDPRVRRALGAGVSRHYAVVKPEKPSFYTFVYATIDPAGADIAGAVENLQEIPTDRRIYATRNRHRADVQFSPLPNRFGRPLLTRVLPADERCFKKWNADPYEPDKDGDGRVEDDGAAYLLPYWMARYHGFIRETE
ncbi:MAG TPA: two-component regulator propeller domain-containing protein [Candidatus Hydrogenedentes bacterium]|jgi:hypothetical protein|nr:MAG: Two component regulator propeller [Candidatus Hydrogenedentes bacterium ADurb.Bin101]HOC68958.1 two-component regulator propeller domain-containing protein [Candidatus Hydrogenedentota bacterium]HQM99715.1 two-component regulator propeller domain-containing protein [Candidatus Hydrogenedentota bacterium]